MELVRTFRKGRRLIRELRDKDKGYIEKKYLNKGSEAEREYHSINRIEKLLGKEGFKNNTYKAVSFDRKNNSILTEKVEGVNLHDFLKKKNRGAFPEYEWLKREIKTLGRIYRLVQEDNRASGEGVIFRNRKVFAAATHNFIVNKHGIIPIDLGSSDREVTNLEQVARFVNFLSISGSRPWDWIFFNKKHIAFLEEEFLEGYFGEPLDLERKITVGKYKINSYENIKKKFSLNPLKLAKRIYLKLFCNYMISKEKKSLRSYLLQMSQLDDPKDLPAAF